MKKNIYFCLLGIVLFTKIAAQDTFSIVAADSITKEVGGAGASCVDLTSFGLGAGFLSDFIPGKGAINTQSYYDANNQINARNRMLAGDTPGQIIAWLVDNDKGFDPSVRQYGIVGFKGQAVEAAAYTGSNCLDVKYHKTGKKDGFTYSIQGNILIGAQVIDSMEARFNSTKGDLRCKLMAALQGAKIVGADSRCEPLGTSSLFAFLKVSKPTDAYGQPYFEIGVIGRENKPFEPIDSLQKVFDKVVNCGTTSIAPELQPSLTLAPNPFDAYLEIRLTNPGSHYYRILNAVGQVQALGSTKESVVLDTRYYENGIYYLEVKTESETKTYKLIKKGN